MHRMPWSRSCARKKCNKRELCLARARFLYLFCAFLCPRENGALSVSSLERMAGTTRLELATSAVTDGLSTTGLRRMSRLDVRLSATVGFVGQGRLVFVQRLCNRPELPNECLHRSLNL
jgi:hypothetical protein